MSATWPVGTVAACVGAGGALAGGSDCSIGPFGAVAGVPLAGGARFWPGAGVPPGTSAGGRRTGPRSNNCACPTIRRAQNQAPTATINRPPRPALVVAFLI